MVPPLLRHYSILEVVSHLTLILAPLILFGFLLMFIFARPIAAELDVSYESLAVAYDDLQNAQARLVEAEKMSSVGVMIAGIAHELNNPLAALQGEARILRKELESTDGLPSSVADNFNESVSIQEKAARRMAAIINGLRQYSRQDRDTTEQVVIRDIIDNTLAISSSRIKPIPVVVEVSDGIELVAIFPGKVSQVVGNLVVNAADACRAGDDPRIRVGVSSNAESLLIAVEDNGSGIPEEIQTKVFDPFFTTKDVGEGTGLGLALCKRFAQEMGGDLVFDTKPGATSFTLSVPLDES
jgi:two-component system NtrC family sensor kinase